ncbi:MAG: DUF1353 domain-containing protein [Spirochaetes bacterium]|nr:DUF1353 domain-containing protein [Spirochaetota bacterium]
MKEAEQFQTFQARNKKANWIFKLDTEYRKEKVFPDYSFYSRWLTIEQDGTIIIKSDYAWDGCSFKINFLDLFIFGIPDGVIDIQTLKPKTYYASLVHDVLYQYYGYHGLARKKIDQLFLEMMKTRKFSLASLYYIAVRLLGRFFISKRKTIKINGKIFFSDYYQELCDL